MPEIAAIVSPRSCSDLGDPDARVLVELVRQRRQPHARHVELNVRQSVADDRVERLLERRPRKRLGEDPQVHQTPPLTSAELDDLARLDRPRDRHHRLHGRQAVVEARAGLRHTVEDRGGEAPRSAACRCEHPRPARGETAGRAPRSTRRRSTCETTADAPGPSRCRARRRPETLPESRREPGSGGRDGRASRLRSRPR